MDGEFPLPRANSAQGLLLRPSARGLARSIGLDWWAALKLSDDGWLSFNPDEAQIADEGMEAEFVFLGSLVAAGCDPRMLELLLRGLEEPYQYDIGRMYYDWTARAWRTLPEVADRKDMLAEWLSELGADGDVDVLEGILTDVQQALEEVVERGEDAR